MKSLTPSIFPNGFFIQQLKPQQALLSKQTHIQILGAIIGLGLLFVGPFARASDDVFVVPRVFVSAQSESATAAKQEAVIQGRRAAMDLLLRRLVPEEDWVYLPNLAANQPAVTDPGKINQNTIDPYSLDPAADPASFSQSIQGYEEPLNKRAVVLDDQALQQLGQGFEVFEEKSSPTTYRAYITYRFKPAEIRDLLITSRIPYSEAQTRTALVIPVLETARGLYLWEQNNPWLNAWQARPLSNELTPLAAPLGDLEDSAALTAKQALAFDSEKLEKLAQRYGVPQVIIAHARLTQKDGQDRLRVRLVNGYRESGSLDPNEKLFPQNDVLDDLANRAGQDLESYPAGSALPAIEGRNTRGLDHNVAESPGAILSETWITNPSGQFPGLADQAIVMSVTKYAAGWKAQTLIDHSVSSILNASAFFRSLSEWKQIRAALISTPLVASVQVRNLSKGGAELSIRSFGDPGKLVVAMESQGISLWTLDVGVIDQLAWNIATPSTAAQIPPRLQREDPAQILRQRGAFGTNDGFGAHNNNYADPGIRPSVTPVTTPFDVHPSGSALSEPHSSGEGNTQSPFNN